MPHLALLASLTCLFSGPESELAPAPEDPPVEARAKTPTHPSRRERLGKAPIGFRIKAIGELGGVGVLSHHLQLDRDGTYFDLRRDGREDTMFLFGRLSLELEIDDHHQVVLLFQPLRLRTETVLEDDLVADDTTFAAGSGLDIFYGFDFYRVSYAYDFFTDPGDEVSLGLSLQFRNFRSSYVSKDGTQSVVNTNFGPVPAIKFRGRHELDTANFWYGAEVDGFYANIPFINGGEDPVEGLILDASLRAGVTLAGVVKPFVNLRYLGGGARGTNTDKVGYGDGYSSNWLHTLAITAGTELAIPVIAGDRQARDREIRERKARRRAKRKR
jgi:hypothetical protein